MRPAGPVAALAASALALGAASPDRLSEAHIALVSVSAQPCRGPAACPRCCVATGAHALARQLHRHGHDQARARELRAHHAAARRDALALPLARVTQVGATTWQYVAPVPRWFPAGTATLVVEVHLTVRGQVEELGARRYGVTVR